MRSGETRGKQGVMFLDAREGVMRYFKVELRRKSINTDKTERIIVDDLFARKSELAAVRSAMPPQGSINTEGSRGTGPCATFWLAFAGSRGTGPRATFLTGLGVVCERASLKIASSGAAIALIVRSRRA